MHDNAQKMLPVCSKISSLDYFWAPSRNRPDTLFSASDKAGTNMIFPHTVWWKLQGSVGFWGSVTRLCSSCFHPFARDVWCDLGTTTPQWSSWFARHLCQSTCARLPFPIFVPQLSFPFVFQGWQSPILTSFIHSLGVLLFTTSLLFFEVALGCFISQAKLWRTHYDRIIALGQLLPSYFLLMEWE